ncbi:MAG: DsbA family protein [Actinomycetia bacterium]|nr:DsbA family protein [Actinomycetes bacterium]
MSSRTAVKGRPANKQASTKLSASPSSSKQPQTAAERRAKIAAARRSQDKWAKMSKVLIVLAVVVALIIVVVLIAVLVNNAKNKANQAAVAPSTSTATITPPNATSDGLAIQANPDLKDATLTVDLHTDYQCPYCKTYETRFGPALEQLVRQGDIKLNYHVRSFLDGNLKNTSSTMAAIAATCADTVGSFQGYHDVVFANQPPKEGTGYTDDQLRNAFATQAGIQGDNLTTFQQCYDNRSTSTFVQAMESGNMSTAIPGNDDFKNGVRSTPTFLVNNKTIDLKTMPSDAAGMLTYLKNLAGVS